MDRKGDYLLVEASVLPDIFPRVIEAKRLLACGKAKSLSEAADQVGISRSSLYKYKDSVFTHETVIAREISTMSMELLDRSGVLAGVIAMLSEHGANILTINQNIPVDGVAPVSISMRIGQGSLSPRELLALLEKQPGVVNIRLLAS